MRIVRPIDVTDAVLLSSNVPEADYAAWAAGTTYGLGALVIKTATHTVYRSLQAGNVGHDPVAEADPANPVYWQVYSATNRWRMFDDLVNAQTSNPASVAVTLVPTDRVDSVVLLNVSASTVQITMTDATDGVVFDQTYDMVSASGIQDWYGYFFEPIVRKSELGVTGLPAYVGAQVGITASEPTGTAAVGECVVGLSRELGGTQYGARVGIRDYSVKSQDAFGNFSITQRAFSKRGSFTLEVPGSLVSELVKLLATYRATPIVYIGADSYDATIVYGFFKDFEVDIAYPDVSFCSIEIEGLT